MRDDAAPGPPGVLWALTFRAAVGVAGAATMVVELAAVRLLAPWFGTSAGVWTNVIGVILAGLSLGYLQGARLASRPRPAVWIAVLVGLAAVFVATLPVVVEGTAGWFLPPGVALHEAAGLVTWGSLAVTGIAFLPAAFLLGCIGPLAVEVLAKRTGLSAGTAGGHVLAVSTLGSLLGTFATTHLLVPELGLTTTFALCGVALIAVALFFALEARASHAVGGGALAALVVAGVGGFGVLRSGLLDAVQLGPALPAGVELLARAESAYQAVRVVEEQRDGMRLRQLQVNEGFDSYQSVWQPSPGFFGPGYYYDLFALPTWWDAEREDWNVLVLGLGAGSAVRVLQGAARPDVRQAAAQRLHVTGVEIDPVVVALAREYLDLAAPGDEQVEVASDLDGRVALRLFDSGAAARLDYVILDAYAHQVEIPAHLASVEFFEEVFARLAPGGWLGVNVGGFGFDDPVVAALAATIAHANGRPVLALRVPQSRNYILFARRDSDVPGPPWELARSAPGEAPGEAPAEVTVLAAVRSLCARLEFQGAHRFLGADATPLTDDRSPIERLQAQSLAGAQERRWGAP